MADKQRSLRTRAKRNKGNKDTSSKSSDQSNKGDKLDERRLKADMCDCLDRTCDGCWFPCPKCSSKKCGHECRKTRSWDYVSYDVEGTSTIVENPLLKQ